MLTGSTTKAHSARNALDEIVAGLAEGDAFPPERELAARLGIARDTLRQAVRELLVEGRLQRRGRGTVVAKPKLVQRLSLDSYTEGALRMGRKPGRLLVGWEAVDPDPDLAAELSVTPGTQVLKLERVLLADDLRIGLESTYLPLHRFGHFAETFDPTTSLYAAIRAEGVTFAHGVERIETVLPSPREAKLMETTPEMPVLRLRRRSIDSAGQPIEVVQAMYRGDRVAFETVLRPQSEAGSGLASLSDSGVSPTDSVP